MLSEKQARALVERALAAATLPEVTVHVTSRRGGHTRFAGNAPTTTGETDGVQVRVTAGRDGRHATVSGTGRDADGVRALVAQAEQLAALAPPDPEAVAPLGPQRYVPVREVDRAVRRFGPKDRARLAQKAIDVARKQDVIGAGFITHQHVGHAIGTSAGLRAWHESTQLAMSMTCRTRDGTGSSKAGAVSHRARDVDGVALAESAASRALRSRAPQAMDPGPVTVVLEPQAVADLLEFLSFGMDRRAADEGRSVFSAPGGGTRIGQSIFADSVTLWSDPADAAHPSSPIGPGGLPLRRQVWIERGVLRDLPVSRYWARKLGRAPAAMGRSLFLGGATGTAEDLLAKVERGVWVTRFWYNRMLNPRELVVTGLTRDGVFAIEGGKVTHSLKNMRYNDSPLTLLRKVVALGAPVRAGLSTGRVVVVPPMVVEAFRFSSLSDAV